MSAVWRAVDERLARQVAVKLPAPQLSVDHADRLRQEARACARIDHPGAVEVFDFGEVITAQGRVVPFTVMPLLSGEPLAARLATGRLPWREAVQVAARVASVLAAAHGQGVVHQDVSTENVHLTPHGAKLLDFGLATVAGEPDVAARSRGTPPYVAPERLAGEPPHPASDVYALGVLLFESLTGCRPYPETTWEELDGAHRSDPAPRPADVPGLPAKVAALNQRCLSATPQARPSAAAVAAVLSGVSTPEPRLPRRVLAATGLVTGLLATGLVVSYLAGGDGPADYPAASPDQQRGPSASLARPPPASAPPAPDEVEQAPVLTWSDALDRFHDSLEHGERAGEIRADVSIDLGQLAERIGHAAADLATAPAGAAAERMDPGSEITGMVDELRRKLDARLREGALTRQAAEGLHDDLSTLAVAVLPGASVAPTG